MQGVGARFAFYFGLETTPIYDYREVVRSFDFETNQKFIRESFKRGLYFHDYGNQLSPTHHGFSYAHSLQDIDETLEKCEEILKAF